MKPDGAYGFWDMYERPLSQERADRYVRWGMAGIGLGVLLLAPSGILLTRLQHTPNNHRQIVIAAAISILIGYAVIQYSGLKFGHGKHQGGTTGFQPRTVRRLSAVREYYLLTVPDRGRQCRLVSRSSFGSTLCGRLVAVDTEPGDRHDVLSAVEICSGSTTTPIRPGGNFDWYLGSPQTPNTSSGADSHPRWT